MAQQAAQRNPPPYVNYSGKGIGAYSENEPWDNFIERLSGHLDACNIRNEDQRRDILISTVGANTYALMKNLLGEEKPKEKSYRELVDFVKSHKCPSPPWQSERIKFLNRDWRKDETVMEYLAVLKNMMSTCKYKANEYNNQLRDRLLHGCNDREMQKAIIDVGEELTVRDAIKAALQYESKLKSLKELGGCEEQVNVVYKNCWRCKGRHPPENCRFKKEKCHLCSKVGHIKRCCPSSRPTQEDQDERAGKQSGRGQGRGRYGGRGRSRGARRRPQQHQSSRSSNSDNYVQEYTDEHDNTNAVDENDENLSVVDSPTVNFGMFTVHGKQSEVCY